jgi:riboflavin kinase/FMN adenylyltransferase
MERYFGSENVPHPFENAVIALGNFDGVHLGHQYLLKKTVDITRDRKGTSVVFTFDPHPVKILAPESCPPLIQTLEQRLRAFEDLNLNACVIEPFTHEFARQTPEHFFEHVLIKRLGAKAIVIGYDFTFGFHRGGTVEIMEQLGSTYSVDVAVIEARFVDDLLLSSTEIRHFISIGAIDKAVKMLGRWPRIEGKVMPGKGLGGYLGAHTANIDSANELLPGNGVYLTVTHIEENPPTPPLKKGGVKPRWGHAPLRGKGGIWPSITSIGYNPTFPGERLSVETHLIGFDGNLLGKTLFVDFLEKMRDQIAFPSVERLHEQIEKDIEEAKKRHAHHQTL